MDIKEFFEDLKKDKKKMFFALLIPLVLIVSVVLGIIFSGDENVDGNKVESDALLVPVDTLNGKEQKSKSQLYSSSFFSESDTVIKNTELPQQDNQSVYEPMVEKKKNPYAYTSRKSYYETPGDFSNTERKSVTSSEKKSVQVTEPDVVVGKEKRKRVPTDGAGNMATSTKMARGSIANDDKIVKSGSYVKIRIAEDMVVDGLKVPKNTVVTGMAKPAGERMIIKVTSVKVGATSKTVDWTVFDEDGNEGIAIPANVLNDIAKDASGEAVEKGGGSVETKVPVVGSVKVNLKKKTQEVSFVLRNGHRVYIKEKK